MRYSKKILQDLETLLKELNYTVRYEKGNFQSGYCLVENNNMAVVNRFFETDARINALVEIIGNVKNKDIELSEKSQKLLEELCAKTKTV
jgi:hypothetical protein